MQTVEITSSRQDELLREAASRQSPLTLSCRLEGGWTTSKSFLLGFDRSSGDLVVAYPAGPDFMQPGIVDGQLIGVSFRRAHRRCVFETSVVGRCSFSNGRAEDVPALRLLWPASIFELEGRLYYRTPVPGGVCLPVQVRPWDETGECEEGTQPFRGKMLNLSAGGVSLLLKQEDNPRWKPDTRVVCSFVASPGEVRLDLYGHMRYLDEIPDGVRMGVQFIGLDTSDSDRHKLEQIIELTRTFQEIERKRLLVTA